MHARRSIATVTLGAIALAAAPARADGVGVVAVGSADVDVAPARATLVDVLRAERAPGTRVVADALAEARRALHAGAVPVATLARVREVRDTIAEGWRAYLQVSIEFAASRLAAARTAAEPLVVVPGGLELYADASLRLGAVLAHEGRADESRAALRLALALDPTRPVTLAEFSPDVVDAVAAAARATPATARVRIASPRPGTRIAIDGVDRGAAPLELEVELGQHVLVARGPHGASGLAVAVDETHTVFAVDPGDGVLGDAEAALDGDPRRGDAGAQLDAVARYGELDEVVLLGRGTRRGGPIVRVQRCVVSPAGPLACTAVIEVGFGDERGLASAIREAWAGARTATPRETPSAFAELEPGRGGDPRRCGWCRSPWLWGGVAAGALVTTALVVVLAGGSRPPPVVSVDPGAFTR